jgi:hypothetical protein
MIFATVSEVTQGCDCGNLGFMTYPTPQSNFERVRVNYLPNSSVMDRYDAADAARVLDYLPAIVQPDELERQLDPDFLHIDGAIALQHGGAPQVQHIAATESREQFIQVFRSMVNHQITPAGAIEGVWLPRRAYQHVEDQVERQLPYGVELRGRLLGAAAVRFPYVLRPDGMPLDLPPIPSFQQLLRPGEQPFTPLHATGNRNDDYNEVNVVQAVYGTDERITARIGLVWDDRAVPFAINRQILARRAGEPLFPPTPREVAENFAATL